MIESSVTVDVGEPCAPGVPGVPVCPADTHHQADITVGAVIGLTVVFAVLLTAICLRWRTR